VKVKPAFAFAVAAACFGAGIACVEIGVRAIVGEQADEAWNKVTEPVPAKKE
jgi:hypothetical protein